MGGFAFSVTADAPIDELSLGLVFCAGLRRRVCSRAVPWRSDRVLRSLATILVALRPIFRLAEWSTVHAATVAGHFQMERLANAVHYAKRSVSGQ